MNFSSSKLTKPICIILILIGVIGVTFRFINITENQFIYYDEGLYLNFNRELAELLDRNLPVISAENLAKAVKTSLRVALTSNKALWYALMDLRIFFMDAHDWYFSRLLAAIFGSLSVIFIYLFARRYYDSKLIGLVAVALLAVFPSHVYYSRLGMQETLSALFYILGIYFYLFPRRFTYRTFLSGFFLACCFFTNYRMIILPLHILICEFWSVFIEKEKFNKWKLLGTVLIFFIVVFGIGMIDQGRNARITFAWMFRQGTLSKGHFDLVNFFSYLYYLFRFEGLIFTSLFFGSIYLMIKEKGRKFLPFALALFQMALFSLPQEKGMRYITVVMPFMVMAVAYTFIFLFEKLRQKKAQAALVGLAALMVLSQSLKVLTILKFNTDYKEATEYVRRINPKAKILSSQPSLMNLYVDDYQNVREIVGKWEDFLYLYSIENYQYLVLGPQAYIGYTDDGLRFSKELLNYLNAIVKNVPPVKEFDHFSPALLERFVLEHNENLMRSIEFLLSNKDGRYSKIRIYDIKDCMRVISALDRQSKQKSLKYAK